MSEATQLRHAVFHFHRQLERLFHFLHRNLLGLRVSITTLCPLTSEATPTVHFLQVGNAQFGVPNLRLAIMVNDDSYLEGNELAVGLGDLLQVVHQNGVFLL